MRKTVAAVIENVRFAATCFFESIREDWNFGEVFGFVHVLGESLDVVVEPTRIELEGWEFGVGEDVADEFGLGHSFPNFETIGLERRVESCLGHNILGIAPSKRKKLS